MLAESCPVQGCLAPLFHNKRTGELRCTKCDGSFERQAGRITVKYVKNPPKGAVVPRTELQQMATPGSQPGAPV